MYGAGSGAIKDSGINRNGKGLDLEIYSSATIETSTISGNTSGGIHAYGSGVVVRRSTVADNESQLGGGLYLHGSAVIENSTLTGNTAQTGGAIWALRDINVTATTISGNTAHEAGGIFLAGAGYNVDEATIDDSIVAGNSTTGGGAECVSNEQTVPAPLQPLSGGGNVFGLSGCGTAEASDVLVADPMLGPLADNGGPTPTRALLPASSAIGNAPNLQVPVDQRGVARDESPDSGAFERE